MNLYYDSKVHMFGLKQTETSESVFETYASSDVERIGRKKGTNPAIIKDNVKLLISTNYWPEKVNYEWFHADIYINEIHLLPLSRLYDNGKTVFLQNTIRKDHEDFDWFSFLSEVCQICNHCDAWLNNELELLLAKLPKDFSNFEQQIEVLKTIRLFDSINPFYRKKYRSHFDDLIFDVDRIKLCIEEVYTKNDLSSKDVFNVVWDYIKDYK